MREDYSQRSSAPRASSTGGHPAAARRIALEMEDASASPTGAARSRNSAASLTMKLPFPTQFVSRRCLRWCPPDRKWIQFQHLTRMSKIGKLQPKIAACKTMSLSSSTNRITKTLSTTRYHSETKHQRKHDDHRHPELTDEEATAVAEHIAEAQDDLAARDERERSYAEADAKAEAARVGIRRRRSRNGANTTRKALQKIPKTPNSNKRKPRPKKKA